MRHLLLAIIPPLASAQRLPAIYHSIAQENPVSDQNPQNPTSEATGTFEVKIAPTAHGPDPTIASMSLDKVFRGALEATSRGEMLSSGDPASGNAGYVALERVSGSLAGRSGTFALMHIGTMTKGSTPQLSVQVVPGSGTGELSGIYGTLVITIADGKHSYTLHYGFTPK